jgi:C4-dicarboxylate transporter, DctQ subunit
MGTAFVAVRDWLAARAENILAALLATIFCCFIVQIVFRYILNLPLGWTIEVCNIAWLWAILWGASFVTGNGEDIRFDLIYSTVPAGVRRVFDITSAVILIAVYAYSFPKTVAYVRFMHVEKTDALHIPLDMLFSIYLAFLAATMIRYGLIIWHAVRGDATPATPPDHPAMDV